MLLVLCIDLDDDLGRKTGFETPVIGRDTVEAAAVALATADPEDSDSNVLFQGLHVYDDLAESRAIAAVTGVDGGNVRASKALGQELDTVLSSLETDESIRAIVVTDGAQDESVLPVVRTRVSIDGVRRVVVRQAQDLESIYYTLRQVLDDPETRKTILIPIGVLLLFYPLTTLASLFSISGSSVLSGVSAVVGLYVLARGFGVEGSSLRSVLTFMRAFYAGRVTIVTTIVALALFAIGSFEAFQHWQAYTTDAPAPLGSLQVLAVLLDGAIRWFAAAGVISSLGQITTEFLQDRFEWRYLNAPVYVIIIGVVLQAIVGLLLGTESVTRVATVLTGGTLVGLFSTLTFAIADAHTRPSFRYG